MFHEIDMNSEKEKEKPVIVFILQLQGNPEGSPPATFSVACTRSSDEIAEAAKQGNDTRIRANYEIFAKHLGKRMIPLVLQNRGKENSSGLYKATEFTFNPTSSAPDYTIDLLTFMNDIQSNSIVVLNNR